MATPAAARHELYNELVRVIGPDHAETLMSYLPTEEPGQLATKDDMASLREEIAALRHEFRDDIGWLRSEMTAFRTEIRADFAALSQRVDRMFIAMMGAMAVMIAALIGGIITLN
jgi:hypothetical protein